MTTTTTARRLTRKEAKAIISAYGRTNGLQLVWCGDGSIRTTDWVILGHSVLDAAARILRRNQIDPK